MSQWNGIGAAYAASYAALCAGANDAILTALGRARGRTAFDVGSGTGELVAALAEAGWIATGSEPEPSMREVAAARHPSVAIIDAALPALPPADSAFDAVTANFVINHVPDPRAAAAEMARIARPGAHLVATIWTVSPSWFWAAVREQAGLSPISGRRLPADKDFERTAAGFAQMLSQAGWLDVEVSEQQWTWRASRAALWASATGGVASAGMFYLSLGDRDRALFRRAFDELCDRRSAEGAIPLEHTAALAVGRAG